MSDQTAFDLPAHTGADFRSLLAYVRNVSTSESQKGDFFERMCLYYLRNDPPTMQLVGRTWRWGDAPTNHGQHDVGIDLVAEDPESLGRYWAIQCKCYDGDDNLPYADVATFWSTAGPLDTYSRYMLFTTTDHLSKHLRDQVKATGTVLVTPQNMAASNVDWAAFVKGQEHGERVTFDPKPHQEKAIAAINAEFDAEGADRTKATLACGTGKTLMSLRLAETRAPHGNILFAAPSIALVAQALRDWSNQARVKLRALVVCSDPKASSSGRDDAIDSTIDIGFPATTDATKLAQRAAFLRKKDPDAMIVVFSTYQSMQVVVNAQQQGMPSFDLIVCDEAHRTTGYRDPSLPAEDAPAFQIVHDDSRVHGAKRLYMTATERIYGDTAKQKARAAAGAHIDSHVLFSMDDEAIYGRTCHELTFAQAIEQDLLCDYKVIVLAVHEEELPEAVRAQLSDDGSEIKVDDYAKIVGTYKALATHGANTDVLAVIDPNDPLAAFMTIEGADDEVPVALEGVEPLHRAVGFCGTIASSKAISQGFSGVVDSYLESTDIDAPLTCELRHVDGTMDSKVRNDLLSWLAEDVDHDQCRILTNARCLSEGVDVPSLDAAIFFAPRKSKIDIVQAVGRVMRTFKNPVTGEGKRYGYIILPVFIPSGMTPEEALGKSTTFDVVWGVLQALRSHDERIEARINALSLTKKRKKAPIGAGTSTIGQEGGGDQPQQPELDLSGGEQWKDAIYARTVEKVGERIYWDSWADDVARIAQRHIEQIRTAVDTDAMARAGMVTFLKGLQESLNPGITEQDAIEMVAQHMITLPVFDALFGDFAFASTNPISQAIEAFLQELSGHGIGEMSAADKASLDELYASVRRRATMVVNDAGRQELVKNLYNEFFKAAFKSTSEKLGIVYTPNEIVEFILRFSDRVLRREFGKGIADEGVHVLDPFAGTGTFMARLIESDLIPDDKLEHKYLHELHSNEILLLAYYIMVVNIEYAYHSRTGEYVAYPLALLTDTFQMTEDDDTIDESLFVDNSLRKLEQNDRDVWLCCGNPPWSAGQRNANDNAANEHYESLDKSIELTYVARSESTLKNKLYDSYVRAFRWASDRITRHGDSGLVAFVTNAGWLRSAAGAGVRRCFVEEFNSIFVYDLRGNQRTQGEESRREGGKAFDSGSRAPVAVTVLVKNPTSTEHGVIRYYEVGDYKTREEKLNMIGAASTTEPAWTLLIPDRHGDWLDQRDDSWYELAPMGHLEGTKKTNMGMWSIWSLGIATNRDVWVWGYSRGVVETNVERLVGATNREIARIGGNLELLDYDSTKYSWTRAMKGYARKSESLPYSRDNVVLGLYRPFNKQWLYYEAHLNEMTLLQNRLFPLKGPHETFDNIVITTGERGTFISDCLPDLELNHHGQCFPLYWYEKDEGGSLFPLEGEKAYRDAWGSRYVRHDGITDRTLEVFRAAYPTAFHDRPLREGPKHLTKEDIFYYVYGILHSPEYRMRFAANLQKELPRVPLVEDFERFVMAGRNLAKLHLDYEDVEPWPNLVHSTLPTIDPGPVQKIMWGKRKNPETKKMERDYSCLVYNEKLTIANIPERAQGYVVNGRSPLDWVIDRYQERVDKDTQITNDPNTYSEDPLYIVKLIGSLVTVCMRSLDIIEGLPPIREIAKPTNWPAEWTTPV